MAFFILNVQKSQTSQSSILMFSRGLREEESNTYMRSLCHLVPKWHSTKAIKVIIIQHKTQSYVLLHEYCAQNISPNKQYQVQLHFLQQEWQNGDTQTIQKDGGQGKKGTMEYTMQLKLLRSVSSRIALLLLKLIIDRRKADKSKSPCFQLGNYEVDRT